MRRIGRLVSLSVTAVLVGSVVWAWFNRLAIYDWVRLRDYTPPAEIMRLATNTTMNEQARRLFFVQHPELNNAAAFNKNCSNGGGEVTIVLGCYITNRGIYIFNVEDPRLDGVKEVTAAHELLHAAYERLSEDERAQIDQLTRQVFERLNNDRIIAAVENYRRRDPSIVPNELHSILGTEVRNLPAELEEYYSRYFTNRAQIVNFAEQYESTLTERRNRAATLETEIRGLRSEIDQLEATLAIERAALESGRSSVTTQQEADAFNARVRAYNDNIRYLNTIIRQYNTLIKEYEANAVEQQELYDALSSQPTL